VQSGGGITHVLSVHEGNVVGNSCVRLDISGHDVDEFLQSELKGNGKYDLIRDSLVHSSAPDKSLNAIDSEAARIVRDIKETLAYTCLNFSEESSKSILEIERKYELPDGTTLVIGQERFKCASILFQPSLIGRSDRGIQEAILHSIGNCDETLRPELLNSIVLGGGNCMFPDLPSRLGKELGAAHVITPSNMKYSAWTGGSILSALPTFNDKWLLKEQYDEFGPAAIHKIQT
jgi:actin